MSYIKINKDSLDYDYYSMFHSYTMNNFVRNIMRKGKYKKALKIARLGLIGAIKRIYRSLLSNTLLPVHGIPLNFKRATPTYLSQSNYDNIIIELTKPFENENTNYIKKLRKYKFKKPKINTAFNNHLEFLEKENKKEVERKLYEVLNNPIDLNKNTSQAMKLVYFLKSKYDILCDDLSFQKIYTRRPSVLYYKNRKYTVFDLVIQVYAMLANIWYMKKIKVSGRTVLVPTPLRPYRRVSVVTQMIMKGLRKLRRQERFIKKAMINTISQEFWQLGLYYNPVFSHPTITASNIWQLKEQSHKELVANLKNIKHANYI